MQLRLPACALLVILTTLILPACGGAASPAQSATATQPALHAVASPTLPALIDPAASWIEVDLAKQVVILHQGGSVIAQYAASTGVTTDPQYATPPGLYQVQSKDKGPVESVPGVFVSDVLMFDIGRGNGFHSRPMDAQGHILDATLGTPATAGCVRVGESAALFDFAKVGMKVWIH
jgi:lipoprotein-anchoring transpeptidase ErfK/SrfK